METELMYLTIPSFNGVTASFVIWLKTLIIFILIKLEQVSFQKEK